MNCSKMRQKVIIFGDYFFSPTQCRTLLIKISSTFAWPESLTTDQIHKGHLHEEK